MSKVIIITIIAIIFGITVAFVVISLNRTKNTTIRIETKADPNKLAELKKACIKNKESAYEMTRCYVDMNFGYSQKAVKDELKGLEYKDSEIDYAFSKVTDDDFVSQAEICLDWYYTKNMSRKDVIKLLEDEGFSRPTIDKTLERRKIYDA